MTSDLTSRAAYTVAKARHRWRRRSRRSNPAPVVVFSMAKTGSSAVVEALRAAGVDPVHHVHDLDPAFLVAEEQEYQWSGRPWRNWDAQVLARRPPTVAAPWRVVSLARDPIAQSVSAFFQPAARRGYLGGDATVDALLERFDDRLERMPMRWFEAHVLPAFGIDVYAAPFDRDRGHQRLQSTGVELLLLRCEDVTTAGPEPLARLVGVDDAIEVPRVNRAEEKDHADLYRAFLAAVRPSAAVLDRTYSSRYVQHFYSETEIEGFRRRWAGDHGETSPR
jgi:Putative capsular polysaccharide synthesis protein